MRPMRHPKLAENPIGRGCTHPEQMLPCRVRQRQMPVTFQGGQQLRKKRYEPLATDVVNGAPGRDQSVLNGCAVPTDATAPFAPRPFAPENLVQKPRRVLPMEAGGCQKLVEDPFLFRPRCVLIADRRPATPILVLLTNSCVSSLPTSFLLELGNISSEATAPGKVTFLMSQCEREFLLTLDRRIY